MGTHLDIGPPLDGAGTLDEERCWRAWVARDRRFDGRFFMGVRTTGIYCRPGCPARLPARRNVTFYPSAAAAEHAGFRPCRRCRPESAPGSAAAAGTSAIVARALRLIEAGALDEGSVEALATRVGVTSRWLRTLFVERFGAGPLAVALTRRTHLARRLIDGSDHSMESIALATGFGSARRLRHALQKAFGRPASAMRREQGADSGSSVPRARGTGGLSLVLRARGAFDPDPTLEFFAARAIPGVEEVEGRTWRRTAETPAGPVIVAVAPHAEGLAVTLTPPQPGSVTRLAGRIARAFDLAADAAGIASVLRRDPWLRRRLSPRGVRLPVAWDPFEMGVRAIVGQQISVAAARTILGRLVVIAGTPLATSSPGLTHLFPSATALANADLTRTGLPAARRDSLRAFSAEVACGALDLEASAGLEPLVERLQALPGVGDWTAHVIALRGLAEPDAFPAGDLVLRQHLADRGRLPAVREVLERGERWRPWRAYAAVAIWAAKPGTTAKGRERRPHAGGRKRAAAASARNRRASEGGRRPRPGSAATRRPRKEEKR